MPFFQKRYIESLWDTVCQTFRHAMFHHIEYIGIPERRWSHQRNNIHNRLAIAGKKRLFNGLSSMPDRMRIQYHKTWMDHDPMHREIFKTKPGKIITSNKLDGLTNCQSLKSFFDYWGVSYRVIITLPSLSDSWFPVIYAYSGMHANIMNDILGNQSELLLKTLERLNHELMQYYSNRFNPYISPHFFSEKALKVIKLVSNGHSNQQAADKLSLSEDGVKYHLKTMREVLNAKNVTHLISISKDMQIV